MLVFGCWHLLAEDEPGYVVKAGVGRAGHNGSGNLDQDHLDEELHAGGEEVAGVAGG